MNASVARVTCPTCKRSGNWFATAWGPFCSKRCKLIDLGKWLGGEHVISEPLHPEHLEKYADRSIRDHETGSEPGEN